MILNMLISCKNHPDYFNLGIRRSLKSHYVRNFFTQINCHFRSLVYGKLLLLWICVLAADYFLEFRFEYLWPAWLFLRSVYDSYKYQGLVSFKFSKLYYDDARLIVFLHSLPTGLFSILYLHRGDIRHDLLPLRPYPLAVLRREYLRLGPVCVAHRYD